MTVNHDGSKPGWRLVEPLADAATEAAASVARGDGHDAAQESSASTVGGMGGRGIIFAIFAAFRHDLKLSVSASACFIGFTNVTTAGSDGCIGTATEMSVGTLASGASVEDSDSRSLDKLAEGVSSCGSMREED